MGLCRKGGILTRSEYVKRYVEGQKDIFLRKVYELENPFYLAFYEQSIEGIVADAYEFFLELHCENNFFYDHIQILNEKRGQRLFRLMAAYHTIKMIRKKRQQLDNEEMKAVLFAVFLFDEREKRLYDLLYDCACRYEAEFQSVFNGVLIKYVFGLAVQNPFSLAFVQYFCYNSYNNFMQSFTRYISLNRRLQKLAN